MKFEAFWIADETLSRGFDISFQSKQNLSSKRKIKMKYISSVSVYYLATISYTSRNNKYIHKISRSGKEGY